MQAAGASSGGITSGGGQQFPPPSDKDISIFAGGSENVNGVSGSKTEAYGGVKVPQNQGGDLGFVERLDRIDAAYQKPNQQNEFLANELDFYA